ncbi:U-scoloptoxin(05)-Sm1a [Ischnura elegans]|uniref:U-scoloptoxin(05)-Sm1a n=1 Tax=Ischnura elegans TaxID=197161 RepID=UPI001ED87F89|nr:U-scoloptoxin(05)-Sm1a [Ischnura elegans]
MSPAAQSLALGPRSRPSGSFGLSCLLLCVALLSIAPPAAALQCYQCGLYTDGVGSITPCINYTAEKHLKDCPSTESHCIKYVSEGSTVRDCAHECVEKESWGIKIYCCREEGCNGASGQHLGATSASRLFLLWLPSAAILAQMLRQHL